VRDTATGTEAPWPVLERTALKPGAQITGPAIIAEDETSTLIGAGWRATVDPFGYIELLQESA
jgi:N-methylhydantoinase A